MALTRTIAVVDNEASAVKDAPMARALAVAAAMVVVDSLAVGVVETEAAAILETVLVLETKMETGAVAVVTTTTLEITLDTWLAQLALDLAQVPFLVRLPAVVEVTDMAEAMGRDIAVEAIALSIQ